MSRERFDWLEQWVVDESDIIKTPGTESNVKEIYDRCHELSLDQDNVILNQFCEFGNQSSTGSRPVRRSSVSSSTCARSGPSSRHGRSSRRQDRPARSAPGPPQGQVRVAHRRSRGAGVPDASLQRVRRAHIQGIGDKHVPSSTT